MDSKAWEELLATKTEPELIRPDEHGPRITVLLQPEGRTLSMPRCKTVCCVFIISLFYITLGETSTFTEVLP